MTAHLDALVRELADAVKGDPDDLPVRLRKGVIFAQSPLAVKIGGSTQAVPVQATGPIPANGTVVWVLESGPRRILLDASRTPTLVGRAANVAFSALPRTYPEGFTVRFGSTEEGWPRYSLVHTSRAGNDVAQTIYSIFGGEEVYQRQANGTADSWSTLKQITNDPYREGFLYRPSDSSGTTHLGDTAARINGPLNSGFYEAVNNPAAPTMDWWLIQHIRHSNQGNDYARQVAYQMTGAREAVYTRRKENGGLTEAGWSGWRLLSDRGVRTHAICDTEGLTHTPPVNTDWRVPMSGSRSPDDGSAAVYSDGTGLVVREKGIYSVTATMLLPADGNYRNVILNADGSWRALERSAYKSVVNIAWTGPCAAGSRIDLYVQVPTGNVGGGYYIWPRLDAALLSAT